MEGYTAVSGDGGTAEWSGAEVETASHAKTKSLQTRQLTTLHSYLCYTAPPQSTSREICLQDIRQHSNQVPQYSLWATLQLSKPYSQQWTQYHIFFSGVPSQSSLWLQCHHNTP